MDNVNITELSADEWDELKFPRPAEQDFDRVVERAISRRGFLGGLLVMGSAAAVFGAAGLRSSTALASQQTRFAFTPIAAQTDSTVHVPEGYSWKTLVSWGDPLFSDAPAFDPAKGVPTAGSDRVFGENTDGMELFLIGDKQVLVVNSEYTNNKLNLAGNEKVSQLSADEVLRLQQFQGGWGGNVFEITEDADGWKVVVDSPYNRRIHHNTPMQISGPAAGHDLLKTEADPTGTMSLERSTIAVPARPRGAPT